MIRHDADIDLLVAGALLDDLDPGELARFEAHQPGCPRCAELGGDLSATLGDLALVAAPRRPPASLGASLVASIRADRRPTPRPGSSAAPGWSARIAALRSRRPAGLGWAAAVGLILVAVGVGWWGVTTRQDLDRAAAETAGLREMLAGREALMSVALAPDRTIATLSAEPFAPAADAVVVYRPGRTDGFVVARGVPVTPPGHVYQLWVADAAGVHPLQTLTYDGQGPLIAPVGRDLAGAAAVMITLEPAGGATGDPGPQVVFGSL